MIDDIGKKATYKLKSLAFDVPAAGTIESSFQSLNTEEHIAYQQVTLGGSDVSGLMNISLSGKYTQKQEYAEVDLEIKYVDIPAGSTAEIECTNEKFSLAKQDIGGSDLKGKDVMDAGPLDMEINLVAAIEDVSALKKTSLITIRLQNVETPAKGPAKKTLLGQAQLKFSEFV